MKWLEIERQIIQQALTAHYGWFNPSGMVAPLSDWACFSNSS
jgi:hypothetical protein